MYKVTIIKPAFNYQTGLWYKDDSKSFQFPTVQAAAAEVAHIHEVMPTLGYILGRDYDVKLGEV